MQRKSEAKNAIARQKEKDGKHKIEEIRRECVTRN